MIAAVKQCELKASSFTLKILKKDTKTAYESNKNSYCGNISSFNFHALCNINNLLIYINKILCFKTLLLVEFIYLSLKCVSSQL